MILPESCFASPELHARSITLEDGSVHTIHFKELPALEFRAWRQRETSDNEGIRLAAIAHLLVAGVCNPDGTPALTMEQAKRLKAGPLGALTAALFEVNGATSAAQEQQGNE